MKRISILHSILLQSFRSTNVLLAIAVAVSTLNLVTQADAQNMVPFKGDFALVSLPAPSNTGCPADTVRFNATGDGQATHMGNTSVSEFVCLNPMTLLFTAQFTITAANGDVIFGNASGYGVPSSPTTFTIHGAWNFNGGTGRFQGVSGSGTAVGHIDLVTGASPHQLVGTMSSVGSSK